MRRGGCVAKMRAKLALNRALSVILPGQVNSTIVLSLRRSWPRSWLFGLLSNQDSGMAMEARLASAGTGRQPSMPTP